MVLADWQIRKWAIDEHGIDPFCDACVNPSSMDLRLGNEFIYLNGESGNVFKQDVLYIEPGEAYLATTVEYIRMGSDLAGVLHLKSSLARAGLDHSLAGFVDVGFFGQLTLEFYSHRPVELHAGQRVVQLVLHTMAAKPINLYNGRYQGQTGPTKAR